MSSVADGGDGMNDKGGEGGHVWAEAHGNSLVAVRTHRPCGRQSTGVE